MRLQRHLAGQSPNANAVDRPKLRGAGMGDKTPGDLPAQCRETGPALAG